MLFDRYHGVFLTASIAGALGLGALMAVNGCTTEPWEVVFHCRPDANPDSDIHGDCFPPDGGGIEPLSCVARGGQCVPMGTSDFREKAVLLWMGAEEEAPDCPDRADTVFYTGFADLSVDVPCAACSCGPASCTLPGSINVDSASFCQGANPTEYSGPEEWDGSCVSPAVLPSGSFSSIGLTAPTVTGCEPIGDPIPKAPGFAPGGPGGKPKSFANGISWKYTKACHGMAEGRCESPSETCLPSTEPPPPEFRQCVQYTLPVDEANLPQCPESFPERVLTYRGTTGKVECSPCECGEPTGAKCSATLSAFQDSACSGVPMSLFENVPATPFCLDISGSPFTYALGSMSAKWVTNEPGTCEPKGGEQVGEVKGVDPRVFCCQGLAAE